MSGFGEEYAAAQTRGQIYWWLGGCFLDKPSEAGLAELRVSVTRLSSGADTPPPVAALLDALSSSSGMAEALAREFTRLFCGIGESYGPPPPFESVYRESRLLGEISVAVMNFYAAAGFAEIQPETGPQDHISAELRFIALLCRREAQAWQSRDVDAALACLKQQTGFHQSHLSRWVPAWCQRIAENSREPLYQALSETLLWFVREDNSQINAWIDELEQLRGESVAAW